MSKDTMGCKHCTVKHLSACLVLLDEVAAYPEHYDMVIGHLHEAARECGDRLLAAKLRDLYNGIINALISGVVINVSELSDNIKAILGGCLGGVGVGVEADYIYSGEVIQNTKTGERAMLCIFDAGVGGDDRLCALVDLYNGNRWRVPTNIHGLWVRDDDWTGRFKVAWSDLSLLTDRKLEDFTNLGRL